MRHGRGRAQHASHGGRWGARLAAHGGDQRGDACSMRSPAEALKALEG